MSKFSEADVSAFIEHYGVKGQKWGVRKKPGSTSLSDDAAKALASKSKIKTQGLSSLSNKELQDYITRVNLEQNYKRLSSTSTFKSSGQKFVVETLRDYGKQQAKNLLISKSADVGKAVFNLVKSTNLG